MKKGQMQSWTGSYTKFVLAAGALAALVASPAQADRDQRAYVAPMFSYSVADGDRLTEDGLGAQLSFGIPLTYGLNVELTAFFNSFESDYDVSGNTDKADFKGIGLGAMVFPLRSLPGLYGIIAAYYGQTDDAPCEIQTGLASCNHNYDSTVGDAGLGYLFSLGDDLNGASLRVEARYRMDSHENEFTGRGGDNAFYDGVFNIGLQFPLGHYPDVEEPEPEPVQVVDVDSDGDGVPNDTDECPNTPKGAIVDDYGCELDSDGDGVADRIDQCPDTPPGTVVNETGCPLSSCRAPFPGEPVDEIGCASGDVVVLRGVTFEFDEARLTANAKVILDGVADTLLSQSDMEVEIGGHTDSRGSDSYNQKLSEQRAIAVKEYLTGRGVDDARMSTAGYGESSPIADNDSDEGRELNRRVELKILGE